MTSDAHPTHSDYVAQQRARVAEIAQQVKAGTLSVLEAARLLVGLRHEVEVADDDPDFLVFVGIESQTDHLPIGEERQHWAASALAGLEGEVTNAEESAKFESTQALDNLIGRFGTA